MSSSLRLVDGSNALEVKLVSEDTLSILSKERIAILKALSRESRYPAELARELHMQVQTVYYHVRLLHEAKLIELDRYEEQGGALAKKFRCTTEALAVVLHSRWKPFSAIKHAKPPVFLERFIDQRLFTGKIIVGSPDPHGRFRSRGSEFCATEFAMFLGQYASFEYPLYYLDTEVKETTKRQPLVVIGGPKVNMLASELNPHLPIRYEERSLELHSTLSGKKYSDNVGVIELVNNPWNKRTPILFLAGSDHTSTRVAVLALLKHRTALEKGNTFDSSVHAKIVQGFDEDGDGIVDAVEILE
ncbi:S-layer protein [Candidatus Micrarchaeota archaeon]|nr:S-layer protein [Candidatus Micrarchaeota archaeon]